MRAEGTVSDASVQFSMTNGKESSRNVIRMPGLPYVPSRQRRYLISENLKEGKKIKIPYFEPLSLAAKESVLEYMGFEKVLVQGRIRKLHHFVETYSGIRISSWLDSEGRVIKEESPAGFVMIAEPEFRATNIMEQASELLGTVAVPYSGTLPDPPGFDMIRYRLTYPDDAQIVLSGGRQQMSDGILLVHRESLPDNSVPTCSVPAYALAATPYLQADHPEIVELASGLTADSGSEIAAVRTLAQWVYENLEKRPVIGMPDALSTLRSRRGDCNEHAALFAALARSIGIPAQIAVGVTRVGDMFYYHAWNEVCLGDRWISLDTTTNQLPADLTHIRFLAGEIVEQVQILSVLGSLEIEVLTQ